jgi:hypothetical protein
MRINLSTIRFAWITIAFVFLTACSSKQSPVGLDLTPVGQEIQRHGYHVKTSTAMSPTAWEVATFRMRSKRSFSFRADQPAANTRDYYCRFSFFEEMFDSEEDARRRLANIHLADPEGPAEERDYLSSMRTGFRVGNVAYVFQTDATIFGDEVGRLSKTIANLTPNAEIVLTE